MIITKETTGYFQKDVTNIIKGIALIFMFIHHMFTFPDHVVPPLYIF